MTTLTVSRWTRYGKDRLYVSTADGIRVGWQDLHTGQVTVERPELGELLSQTLATHASKPTEPALPQADPVSGPSEQPAATEVPEPAAPGWDDLTANRPGQAVRAQADAALAAMYQK